MIQLRRVGWRLLACKNGASPDCIIVVVGRGGGSTVEHVSVQAHTKMQRFFFLKKKTALADGAATLAERKLGVWLGGLVVIVVVVVVVVVIGVLVVVGGGGGRGGWIVSDLSCRNLLLKSCVRHLAKQGLGLWAGAAE